MVAIRFKMNKLYILPELFLTLFIVFFADSASWAQEVQSPRSEKEFCGFAKNPEKFQQLAYASTARMDFSNHGGLINGGVCWWHSRFQRAAIYLTIFRPDLQKPTVSEAKNIINTLRKKNGVVTIPGYQDFNEFSHDFSEEIQTTLEKWQKIDGFLKFKWLQGLSGSSEIPPEKMKTRMDKLYELVGIQKKIAFQMLQLKGVVSHAWNVIGVVKTTDGYDLFVIDSNQPISTEKYSYHFGDSSFHSSYGNFVPYTEESSEVGEINARIKNVCGFEIFPKTSADQDDSTSQIYSSNLIR